MTRVFADTFYWIAITNPNDSAHARVKSEMLSRPPKLIVTTEYVLTEYLNYFSKRGYTFRELVGANVARSLESRSVEVIPSGRHLFRAGLALYRSRPDKGYSLTDCLSMAVMQEQRITDAYTNDHHFEQEGFRAVFRDTGYA